MDKTCQLNERKDLAELLLRMSFFVQFFHTHILTNEQYTQIEPLLRVSFASVLLFVDYRALKWAWIETHTIKRVHWILFTFSLRNWVTCADEFSTTKGSLFTSIKELRAKEKGLHNLFIDTDKTVHYFQHEKFTCQSRRRPRSL